MKSNSFRAPDSGCAHPGPVGRPAQACSLSVASLAALPRPSPLGAQLLRDPHTWEAEGLQGQAGIRPRGRDIVSFEVTPGGCFEIPALQPDEAGVRGHTKFLALGPPTCRQPVEQPLLGLSSRLGMGWSSPGHAGKEGPQLARMEASQGFPRAEAPVGVFARGTTRSIALLWDRMKTDLFQSCGYC